MISKIPGYASLLGLLLSIPTYASADIITNGGFESGLTGWSVIAPLGTPGINTTPGIGITTVTTNGATPLPIGGDVVPAYKNTGTKAVYFVDDNANETLFQSNIALQSNNIYTLSFGLFATSSGANNLFNFTLEDFLGTTIFSTLTNSSSSTAVPVGVWSDYAYNFSVANTGPYTLNFKYTSGATPAKDVLLDGVAINAVPEPMSLALLGAGLVGIGYVRRRGAAG